MRYAVRLKHKTYLTDEDGNIAVFDSYEDAFAASPSRGTPVKYNKYWTNPVDYRHERARGIDEGTFTFGNQLAEGCRWIKATHHAAS